MTGLELGTAIQARPGPCLSERMSRLLGAIRGVVRREVRNEIEISCPFRVRGPRDARARCSLARCVLEFAGWLHLGASNRRRCRGSTRVMIPRQ